MTRELRIGIVGCGKIARAHLNAYHEIEGTTIAGVFDVNGRAARAFAAETGARAASSVEEMARNDGLDAVSICTPPAAHLENCRPFLKERIPILCEKPLEVNAARAARLAAAVKEDRTQFMVAFCHRFHPPIIELKKLIRSGVLGRPILFRNIFGGYLPLRGNHRAKPELSGGGCLIDHCCHSVDLFRFLVGDPTEVQAVAANVMQKLAIEDFGMIQLSRNGRCFGEITASYSLRVCGNWVEWYGTKGTAVVSYGNPGHPDLQYRIAGEDWTTVDCSGHPDRFLGEVGHFTDCVRKGRKPAITVDDGLKASRIGAAVYASAEKGGRVAIPGMRKTGG